MALQEDHPARRVLIAHAECRNECVGRELWWPGLPGEAIDQKWQAKAVKGNWKFSNLAYAYISFDLVLHSWLDHPTMIAGDEETFFLNAPLVRGLLQECEEAARAEANDKVLPLIEQVREFFEIWEDGIRVRLREDKIEWPQFKEK